MDYKSNRGQGKDDSKNNRRTLPKIAMELKEEIGLYDIWRDFHPQTKQYTFYSPRHCSWSRIDMAWVSSELKIDIKEVEIRPNTWADHNPMRIIWQSKGKRGRWTMNINILKDKESRALIEREMKLFFKENKRPESSTQIVWDTAKAYLRGLVIKYTARKNREKLQKRKTLVDKVQELEKKLSINVQDKGIMKEIEVIKHKLNLLSQEEIAHKIKMAKQNYFENANKTGRWLAFRLRKEKEKRQIQQLWDEKGTLINQKAGKKKIVQDFFTKLYKQETTVNREIEQYLERTELPKIPEHWKDILNGEITGREVEEAIRKQKNNKTPGTDGIPAEAYQNLQEILGYELKELFNVILETSKIPCSWTEAYISLIPKDDTDLQQIKNYRPISLLNVDYKIFTSIMAERLKGYMSGYIHTDQSGFLPKRYLKDNVRMVLNILEYYEVHSEKQMALLLLDAQKAFDNVNWDFMIRQLKHMDFGYKFINIMQTIYSKQSAKVLINGEETETFAIQKGTRQGCPLSPLLFILVLETLLRQIRQDPTIEGLKIKKEEYKLLAYADDLVCIIEEPVKSGPKVLKKIEEFGNLAGLKINKEKTKLLTKNIRDRQIKEIEEIMGIKVVKKIKYLGIWITGRCSTLKEDNYIKLMQQIKMELEKWKNLQLSLLGKISAIKMNILPKLIFLFQTIPIHLNKIYFRELNVLIKKFLWQGKKPRIKIKMLQEAKERGGLGLPNWELYYQAAGITWLRDWMRLENRRLLTMEGHDLLRGWHAYLWEEKSEPRGTFQKHYIRKSLLEIWKKIRWKFYDKVPSWLSVMEAVVYPNLLEVDKKLTYKDLLNGQGELKTKQDLKEQGVDLDWWIYTQIQTRYKRDKAKYGIYRGPQELDKINLEGGEKLIKKNYKVLLDREMEGEIVKENMISWMKNFGYTIDVDKWQELWEKNLKLTVAASYKENLYKMFYRWHLSPARIAKMFPTVRSNCWKCDMQNGTFYHLWWTCPRAKTFWNRIKSWIWEVTSQKLELKPEIFLLGMLPGKINKNICYLIVHLITAARLSYAQEWKKREIPTEDKLITKILECAEMVKLTMMLKDKGDTDFSQIWDKWYNWLERRRNN